MFILMHLLIHATKMYRATFIYLATYNFNSKTFNISPTEYKRNELMNTIYNDSRIPALPITVRCNLFDKWRDIGIPKCLNL